MLTLVRKAVVNATLIATLLCIPTLVNSTQVCSLTRLSTDEFYAIDGTSDSNVIAVGEEGDIWRFDGSSWSRMSNSDDENLYDVTVVGSTAFAVGENGTVRRLVGNTWVNAGGFTDDDLLSVWAASENEVWAGGQNGEIWFFNGSSWTDVSNAASTRDEDITGITGDSGFVYAVDEESNVYRFNRSTNSWLSRFRGCGGDDYQDLWSDGAGNLYLVAEEDIRRLSGSSCPRVFSADEELSGISGWTVDGSVVAVGEEGLIVEFDGTTWTEREINEDYEFTDVWVSPTGNAYITSENRRLGACECSDCDLGDTPEFVIDHDNFGVNCLDELIQVDVRDGGSGAAITSYTDQITLDTQSGNGTWSLVSGSGAFSDPVDDDGLALYTWAIGESTATFGLFYPEGSPSIDVDVFQSNDSAVRDIDSEGNLVFSPNGFSVTAAPLSNPPGVVVPFAAPQVAAVDFNLYVTAYGQLPGDAQCGVIENYTGAKTLDFWLTRQNPTTGSITASINGAGIGVGEGSATARPVTFTSGQATVVADYKDVGIIQISLKDTSPSDPALASGIRGGTAGFVVKPFEFRLSNITNASGDANPGAGTASGGVFAAAGTPFSVTVTALDADLDVTPNFGREVPAEGVTLSSALVLPAVGDNPALTNADAFAGFVNGSATGTTFSWPEVGIVNLVPSVADGDYLGAGDVVGRVSGNVGRFIPARFSIDTNEPLLQTACSAGGFSYIGQAFGYAVEPQITATAQAATGEITQNYEGDFFKLTGLPDPVYSSTPATLNTANLIAGGAATVTSLGAGVGRLTFSAGGGLSFIRGAEVSPFNADIRLSQNVIDSDGVTASSNPVEFGSPSGMLFNDGAEQRYGRARLLNAFGSELLDLPVTLRSEFFVDANTGFVPNTADVCTTPVSISLDLFSDNLSAGETCVRDSGSPGASGLGCSVAAAPGLRFLTPPSAGDFNLILSAPGAGNDGSARTSADVPAWLEYDWGAGVADPIGNATFGIFQGRDRRIYTRELY